MTTHYIGLKNTDKPELAGTTFTEDTNFSGEYALNLQNINDILSYKSGYWFDGNDDYIYIYPDNNIKFSTGDGAIECRINIHSLKNHMGFIGYKIDNNNQFGIELRTDIEEMRGAYRYGGADFKLRVSAPFIPIINTWYHILWTFKNGVSNEIYINGKESTKTIDLFPGGDLAGSYGVKIGTGQNAINGNISISQTRIWTTHITSVEAKMLYSGMSIPYKYIGASQTNVLIGSDSDFSSSTITWSNAGGGIAVFNADTTISGKLYLSTLNNGAVAYIVIANEAGPDKKFRFSLKVRLNSGIAQPMKFGDFGGVSGINYITFTPIDTETTITGEFMSSINSFQMGIYGGGGSANGSAYEFDDIIITQIGCVLDLNPSSIGTNQWLDSSGNNLHGTVEGAIPTNLPTNHLEKVILQDISTDQTFTIPAGYKVNSVIIEETSGNAITGNLNVGIGALGVEIVSGEIVGASSLVDCTIIQTGSLQSLTTDTEITISSSDWRSSVNDIYIKMIRIIA